VLSGGGKEPEVFFDHLAMAYTLKAGPQTDPLWVKEQERWTQSSLRPIKKDKNKAKVAASILKSPPNKSVGEKTLNYLN
jgi:hypothetical protein